MTRATDGWEAQALCAQVGGDAWFPEDGDKGRDAKRICGDCPVADFCLTEALIRNEQFGTWGGLNTAERRQLRKGAA